MKKKHTYIRLIKLLGDNRVYLIGDKANLLLSPNECSLQVLATKIPEVKSIKL